MREATRRIDMIEGVVNAKYDLFASIGTRVALLSQFSRDCRTHRTAPKIATGNLPEVAGFTDGSTPLRNRDRRPSPARRAQAALYRVRGETALLLDQLARAGQTVHSVRPRPARFTFNAKPPSLVLKVSCSVRGGIVTILLWLESQPPFSVSGLTLLAPRVKTVSRVSRHALVKGSQRFTGLAVRTRLLGYSEISHAFNAPIVDGVIRPVWTFRASGWAAYTLA